MAYLSTDALKEIVIETIPSLMAESSALVRAGVSNISYDVTDIEKMSLGGPSIVGEGASKPVKNPTWELESVRSLKLVQAHVVSEEFLDSAEGRRKASEMVGRSTATFPAGIDVAIINGCNPADGQASAAYASVNLKDNGTAFTSTDPTKVDEVFAAGLFGIDNAEHILLSRLGFAQLAQLVTPAGLAKIPTANRNGFTFFPGGIDASTFRSVGLDGWTPAQILNTNLGVIGDFSKIGIAFQTPSVRIGREGTINGENLLQENKIAYIIEQRVKFYIDDPASFAVIKDAAAEEEEGEG